MLSKLFIQKKTAITSVLVNKLFLFGILLFTTLPSQAQCAMCRAALESEDGGTKAEAVNDGIVYLMVIPYVLVGILGVVLYRMYTKKKA
ncbi:hypothetical protein OX284_000230 [Flavobacterium sp. SUN046]|uniref:hypothetical protein n=1 Tax=Flavobacterium sp. SUN046 TaxID=3002440 RepID=UPI002DB77B29|nr:hypothetical protein [Flavobacterium sp. SUN046]MEC4047839.1 hypothetical protein [Flavobacterium sp. SUN046]